MTARAFEVICPKGHVTEPLYGSRTEDVCRTRRRAGVQELHRISSLECPDCRTERRAACKAPTQHSAESICDN